MNAAQLWSRVVARLRGPGAWRAWTGMLLVLVLVAYSLYTLFAKEGARLDFAALLARLQPAALAADLALALLIYTLDLALAIGAWSMLLGTLSGFWQLGEHVRVYVITALSRRLPGTFWYILGRAVMYERFGVPRGVTALAGGLELAISVVGGLLVILVTWPLVLSGRGLNPLWLLVPGGIGAALLNPPMVRALVRRLTPSGRSPNLRYRHLLLCVLLWAAVWTVGGGLLWVLAGAITPLPIGSLPAVIGVWATTGVAVNLFYNLLPFGLGATELTLAALLAPFLPGPPDEARGTAFVVAVLMRVFLTCAELGYGVLGALISLPELLRLRRDTVARRALPEAEKTEEVVGARTTIPPKEAR